MVKKVYVPERGDIIYLQFHPQSGREQDGRRPALVLSPRAYNEKVGLALCCPIATKQKGYPFEVELPRTARTTGVVLADHVKSLDWKARNAQYVEKVPKQWYEEVTRKLLLLVG